MDYDKLPNQASWMSKELASELESIEAVAQQNILAKAEFARSGGFAALLLKDEYCKASGLESIEIDLARSWYRKKEKFHKGDRILMVKSSCAETATLLQLNSHSDHFQWHHPHMPSNLHWRCKIIEDLEIPLTPR